MGVKGLVNLLRKVAPHVFEQANMSRFAYSKVAVDFSIYAYKYKCIAGGDKNGWLNIMIKTLCTLLKNNIHPLIVFDGKAPIEKEQERQKRGDKRKSLENKVTQLLEAIDLYQTDGVVKEILHETMKKKPASLLRRSRTDANGNSIVNIDIKFVQSVLEKTEKQIIGLYPEDIQLMKDLASNMGIPCYQANTEAETACAALCNSGQVDAVLSEDSDVLAYGTPIFITKFNGVNGYCEVINHKDLLEALDISKESFRDLCIMCGTDYNSNIAKIGPVNALKLIRKHKDIDSISTEKDTSCLNHIRVREIFTFEGLDVNIDYTIEPPCKSTLNTFLAVNNCSALTKSIYLALEHDDLEFDSDEEPPNVEPIDDEQQPDDETIGDEQQPGDETIDDETIDDETIDDETIDDETIDDEPQSDQSEQEIQKEHELDEVIKDAYNLLQLDSVDSVDSVDSELQPDKGEYIIDF
jgi:5'-3' exonuclease